MAKINIAGAGNGQIARVTPLGLLRTESVGIETHHFVNLEHESAYVLSFRATPVTPDSGEKTTFFYMRNKTEIPLALESAVVFSKSADEIVSITTNPSGTPTGGDSVTPVNSNLGSNKQAVGIFEYGSDIGGLSGGTFYGDSYFKTGEPIEYIFRNWIIMPRNTSLMMCAENGGSELSMTIPFFYLVE